MGMGVVPAPSTKILQTSLGNSQIKISKIGAKIWEGDERRKIHFEESRDSLNRHNLFTEVPFQ